MACVKADRLSRGPKSSSFNPTRTVHGRVYHYPGALNPFRNLQFAFFFSTFTTGTTLLKIATAEPKAKSQIRNSLTTYMIHDSSIYLQSFVTLKDWTTPVYAPNVYQMTIHSNKRPSGEQVRRFNDPKTSEIATIIPGSENGINGCQQIVICWRGVLDQSDSELFITVPVTHRS